VTLVAPSLSDWEGVASFLVVERPDLLDRSVEAQAKALGVSVGDLRGLWRNPDFRVLIDEYTAVAVFNPEVRKRQYEVLRDISLEGERDADKLKAFDIASRQARVKVPERHEVNDRKSIEVQVRHLPGEEGGFVPSIPFNGPEGRKSRLGQKISKTFNDVIQREPGGPFDVSIPTITIGDRNDDQEEE